MTHEARAKIDDSFQWMREYATKMAGNRDDGEDVACQAYLKAVQSDSYRGDVAPKSYLVPIMRNVMCDLVRSRKRGAGRAFSMTALVERAQYLSGVPGNPHGGRSGLSEEDCVGSADPWPEIDSELSAGDLADKLTSDETDLLNMSLSDYAKENGIHKTTALRRRHIARAKAEGLLS